ncbi:nucleotide sugar dehydrogenase [Beggiatoa leptomitoformis]|uniref:Nucleotide sugar dehydrogenase n=1 Tax=Beggiatoa leptomitoformis TaxID=288004 RepID=A0A2N9YG67_9GAMM|nr:nucleotide sugar dehydrogenase [Beggiatoa leptomitoformis]ALG68132.1 nucleotide sugar dehydrogenase [Beggiatoa leptomitoformis]AUI69571.1 nucleotide sugar dehydrogenase [Beggiatoa leptomitoformis]
MSHNRKVSIVGLGYVGLPAAVAFAKYGCVIGFDINQQRIQALQAGHDHTHEVESDALKSADVFFTSNPTHLQQADFHIIAVPTPVDEQKHPDLLPVLRASKTVGKQLKRGDIVVYESTVYPGATEETCVPVLERESGLQCGIDFSVGYSPERINPGDKVHTFNNIMKVVSGFDAQTLEIVAQVYSTVVTAGVYRATSIKIAEAAKVVENTQRDVNIALINELAMIFNRLGIDTHDVLQAAGTKWNFLPFTPGLVGGHCIGVDPYYLDHKARQVGYKPQIIPASRLLNDGMGVFIAEQALQHLERLGSIVQASVVTVLGLSFKENVPDLRNTRVVDIIHTLQKHGVSVQVYDPFVDAQEAEQELGITLCTAENLQKAACVILAVSHRAFIEQGWAWLAGLLEDKRSLVIDVKGTLPRDSIPSHIQLWRL